jgi:hypothetical protein
VNRALKAFLKLISNLALVLGPLLASLMLLAGAIGSFGNYGWATQAGLGVGMALYVLFWSLLIGGVLRLLLSIDDRLERLEGNR